MPARAESRAAPAWKKLRESVNRILPKEESDPSALRSLAAVVDVALEADARKPTWAALLCPCYLCVDGRKRERIRSALQSSWYDALNIVLTLYVLFVEDVVVAFLPKAVDGVVEVVTTVAFAVFALDLVLTSALNRKAIGRVFWWIDFVAVVSVLLELQWFAAIIFTLFGGDSKESLVRAGKAARAGTRAGRVLRLARVLRLVRIFRLVKLLKRRRELALRRQELQVRDERRARLRGAALPAQGTTGVIVGSDRASASVSPMSGAHVYTPGLGPVAEEHVTTNVDVPNSGLTITTPTHAGGAAAEESIGRTTTSRRVTSSARLRRVATQTVQVVKRTVGKKLNIRPRERPRSRVGRRMAQLIEMKVILGVLVVILVLPLLDFEELTQPLLERELEMLAAPGLAAASLSSLVSQYRANHAELLRLRLNGTTYADNVARLNELRESEIRAITSPSGYAVSALLDDSSRQRSSAVFSFLQTNVLIMLLGIQAALLSRDVEQLLVRPIEHIGEKLRPVVPAALARIGADWHKFLGRRDGEELSTKLLLAAVECLFDDLKPEVAVRYRRRGGQLKVLEVLGDIASPHNEGGVKEAFEFMRAGMDGSAEGFGDGGGWPGGARASTTSFVATPAGALPHQRPGHEPTITLHALERLMQARGMASHEVLDLLLAGSQHFELPTDDVTGEDAHDVAEVFEHLQETEVNTPLSQRSSVAQSTSSSAVASTRASGSSGLHVDTSGPGLDAKVLDEPGASLDSGSDGSPPGEGNAGPASHAPAAAKEA